MAERRVVWALPAAEEADWPASRVVEAEPPTASPASWAVVEARAAWAVEAVPSVWEVVEAAKRPLWVYRKRREAEAVAVWGHRTGH